MPKRAQVKQDDEPPLWKIIVCLIAGSICIYFLLRPEKVFSDNELYLRGSSPAYIVEAKSLASLGESNSIDYKRLERDIPWCESRNDSKACNWEYGCKGGMGKWQIIQGTWNRTITLIDNLPEECNVKVVYPVSKAHPIFNEKCNDIVGKWLLYNEGTFHWGTRFTKWGSWKCWSKGQDFVI